MKQRPVSKTREKILQYIISYIQEHGCPPSVREIMRGVGLKSTSSIYWHLQAMCEAGTIEMADNGSPRSIRVPGYEFRKTEEENKEKASEPGAQTDGQGKLPWRTYSEGDRSTYPPEGENPVTMDYYTYPVRVVIGGTKDIKFYSFGDGHWHHGPEIMDEHVRAWLPIYEEGVENEENV